MFNMDDVDDDDHMGNNSELVDTLATHAGSAHGARRSIDFTSNASNDGYYNNQVVPPSPVSVAHATSEVNAAQPINSTDSNAGANKDEFVQSQDVLPSSTKTQNEENEIRSSPAKKKLSFSTEDIEDKGKSNQTSWNSSQFDTEEEQQKNTTTKDNNAEMDVVRNEVIPESDNEDDNKVKKSEMLPLSSRKEFSVNKANEEDEKQSNVGESATDAPEPAVMETDGLSQTKKLTKSNDEMIHEDEVPQAHLDLKMKKFKTSNKKSKFDWSISQEDSDDEEEEEDGNRIGQVEEKQQGQGEEQQEQIVHANAEGEVENDDEAVVVESKIADLSSSKKKKIAQPSPKKSPVSSSSSESDRVDLSSASNDENEMEEELDESERVYYVPGCFKTGEIWKTVWKLLRTSGWKYGKGDANVQWSHLAPNTDDKTSIVGKTKFLTADDVIQYLEHNNKQVLDQACQMLAEESLPFFTKFQEFVNKGKKKPSTSKKSSSSKSKENKKSKNASKGDLSNKTKKKDQKKQKEVFQQVTEEMIYGLCWKTLRSLGWRYARGKGLVSWIYLRPNAKAPSDTVDNVDSFDSVENLVKSWLGDDNLRPLIETILKENGLSLKGYGNNETDAIEIDDDDDEEEEEEVEEEDEESEEEEEEEEQSDVGREEKARDEQDDKRSKASSSLKRSYPKSPRMSSVKNDDDNNDEDSIASESEAVIQQQQKMRKLSQEFHKQKHAHRIKSSNSDMEIDHSNSNYELSKQQKMSSSSSAAKEDELSIQTLLSLPESSVLKGMKFDSTGFQSQSNPITGVPSFDELAKLISMHGGLLQIRTQSTPSTSATTTTTNSEESNNSSPIYMLSSPMSYRTPKYLNNVAKGVPCIHFLWILQSIKKGKVLPWTQFILPAGLSLLRNSFVFLEAWNKYFDANTALKSNPLSQIPDYPKPAPRPKRILKDFTCSIVLPDCSLKETIHNFVLETGAKVIPIENADEKTVVLCDTNDNNEKTLKICADAYNRGVTTIVSLEWITLCIVDAFAHEPTSRAFPKLRCVYCNPKWPYKYPMQKEDDPASHSEANLIGSPKIDSSSNKNILAFASPSSTASDKPKIKTNNCTWVGPPKDILSDGKHHYYSCALNSLRIDEGDFVRILSGFKTIADSGDDNVVITRSNAIINDKFNKRGLARFGRIKALYENAEGDSRVIIQEYAVEDQEVSNTKQALKLSPTDWDLDCPVSDIQGKFVCIRGHEVRDLAICGANIYWQQRVFLI